MMAATDANKAKVATQLDAIAPDGGTDHELALRAAVAEKPEVIFFVTDADLVSDEAVAVLIADVRQARVHVTEFGRRPDDRDKPSLRRLALATGGTYRYFDIKKLPGLGIK